MYSRCAVDSATSLSTRSSGRRWQSGSARGPSGSTVDEYSRYSRYSRCAVDSATSQSTRSSGRRWQSGSARGPSGSTAEKYSRYSICAVDREQCHESVNPLK
eukprot:7467210-Pyramimonas_sp.AAC.1